MATFRAICETCGDLNIPRQTKNEAYQDAQDHVQTPGNNEHIVNVITTQNGIEIASERYETEQG